MSQEPLPSGDSGPEQREEAADSVLKFNPDRAPVISPIELQNALMDRAQRLRALLQGRIPANLRSEIQVEDILQGVFLAAFRSLDSLQSSDDVSLDRWLACIAQRHLINVIKAARCEKRGGQVVKHPFDDEKYSSAIQLWEIVSAPGKTPISAAALAEAHDKLQAALATLPEDRRNVIRLRFFDGKSYSEIAELLDRSESSVRGLLFHGLRQLKEVLGSSSQYLTGDTTDPSTDDPQDTGHASHK